MSRHRVKKVKEKTRLEEYIWLFDVILILKGYDGHNLSVLEETANMFKYKVELEEKKLG